MSDTIKISKKTLHRIYHNAPPRPADGGSEHTGVEAVALFVAEQAGIIVEIIE